MLPNGWQRCISTAIEAFRLIPEREVLQLRFEDGRTQYDYPCTESLHRQFVRAASKGYFVNEVLKPYAQQRVWAVRPHPWTGW
jgi:hypothetical protein